MTECNQPAFPSERHFSRCVETGFDGQQMTTEGAALLLRESDRSLAGVDLGRDPNNFPEGRSWKSRFIVKDSFQESRRLDPAGCFELGFGPARSRSH